MQIQPRRFSSTSGGSEVGYHARVNVSCAHTDTNELPYFACYVAKVKQLAALQTIHAVYTAQGRYSASKNAVSTIQDVANA